MGQGFSMAMSVSHNQMVVVSIIPSESPFSPRDSPRFLMDELDLPHDRANLFEVPKSFWDKKKHKNPLYIYILYYKWIGLI